MAPILLKDLPGVGRKTTEKLESVGMRTCGELVQRGIRFARYQLNGKVGENIYHM